MLGKLIKYEFKATRRVMLPMLAALGIVYVLLMVTLEIQAAGMARTIENDFSLFFDENAMLMFSALVSMLNRGVNVAIVCANLFVVFMRFRKNILGGEGYLTNVLPVSAGQKLLAKLLTAILWAVASLCVIDIAAGVMSEALADVTFAELIAEVGKYSGNYALNSLIGVGIFAASVCLAYNVIYAAMAVGYSKNRHRLLIAIAVGVGLFVVKQLIENIVSMVFVGVFRERYDWGSLTGQPFAQYMWTFAWAYDLTRALVYLAMSVGLFFLARHYLENRLNLE